MRLFDFALLSAATALLPFGAAICLGPGQGTYSPYMPYGSNAGAGGALNGTSLSISLNGASVNSRPAVLGAPYQALWGYSSGTITAFAGCNNLVLNLEPGTPGGGVTPFIVGPVPAVKLTNVTWVPANDINTTKWTYAAQASGVTVIGAQLSAAGAPYTKFLACKRAAAASNWLLFLISTLENISPADQPATDYVGLPFSKCVQTQIRVVP